jgi:tetratricopeptide (TPR) repeat protein
MLGDAYQKSGNYPMAETIWKYVIERGDDLPATQRLADLYLMQNDYPSAAVYLQQLLQLDPSKIHMYYQIGELLAVTDPLKALPFLAQAAALDTVEAPQAKTLYEKLRTANLFGDPSYTLLTAGRQLANNGEWKLALAAFQQSVSLRPAYSEAWALLGEAKQHIALQETGAASDIGQAELELALQLDSGSVLANTLAGMYWERREDYSQASIYLQKAISLSPDDPYLYTALGNNLSEAGDLPSAQLAYESAIQLQPKEPLFYRLLAQFALDNNIQIRELALPALRQALLINPKDSKTLDMMAEVMLALMDYQSAERYALEAVRADAGYAPSYLHLGISYLYQGKSTLALHWLSMAQSIDPASWAAGQATMMIDAYFP